MQTGEFPAANIKWFEGAKLNITENCLDRHLALNGNRPAIIWEPNDPALPAKTYTYKELHREVCRFAMVLKNLGVQKGDRVCIYMPMIPELAFAVLACARIGAVHSVIFGGFSADSIRDRVIDAHAEFLITADQGFRGDKIVPLKTTVDTALAGITFVKRVLVVKNAKGATQLITDREVWLHDELEKVVSDEFTAVETDAEDLLFILYTSGSTGKPKGAVHSCGGYMVYAGYTFQNVFQYTPGDVYFCTADIGWITGHSYLIYGPLLNGATTLMFEGIPTWPDAGRLWEVVDKHNVNILYTAPTAIRSLMSYGDKFLEGKSLSSLKVLGTVGEPINEEAWQWYHDKIGKGRCPVVDTWWQTETGGIMISNMAGITEGKPSFATKPLPGIQAVLLNDAGIIIEENNVPGNLCIAAPWPSVIRTTYGDHERCVQTYFTRFPGYYTTGDGAYRDEEGNYRITGRTDDVLNVSGHRIGTAEIENAINGHDTIIESAVVGFPHTVKGEGIFAFIIRKDAVFAIDERELTEKIISQVITTIGSFAKPDKVLVVPGLPKTRSGKIMRRILKKIAAGENTDFGDVSTLLNPEVVEQIARLS